MNKLLTGGGGRAADVNAWWKWLLLLALLSISMAIVWPPKDKVKLGLDLKGGMSFTVQIDEDRVRAEVVDQFAGKSEEDINREVARRLEGSQGRAVEIIRNRIDSLGIAEPSIYASKGNRIIVQLPGVGEDKRQQAEESLKSVAFLEFRMVHEDNDELISKLFADDLVPDGYAIDRIDGASVYVRNYAFSDEQMDYQYRMKLGRFEAPPGYELLLDKGDKNGQVYYRPFFVKRRREMSGDMLKSARVDYEPMTGKPVVGLEFDSQGTRLFRDVTTRFAPGGSENPSLQGVRYLAIVLDGTLYSAPYIKTAIPNGRAEISGNFTPSSAALLANILNAGSLPAPVKIIEKRSVSPTLGRDSIRSGVTAAAYGVLGVVIFMMIYYRLAGVVANLALLLNALLFPLAMVVTAGFMGIFVGGGPDSHGIQLPVLTLPGIAGIVLTAGMALDANVLIFERMREERLLGKSISSSIFAGYDRAFTAIFDSNLTTFLTGVILFMLGAGPIRGYAVTLCAGIIVSMYTALVATKLVFGEALSRFNLKNLKMMRMMAETNIDFLGKKWIAIGVSLLVIAGSWGYLVAKEVKHPNSSFGIDFTGGSAVSFTFSERIPTGDVRGALEEAGLKDVRIQYQEEMDKSGEILEINSAADLVDGTSAVEVIKGALLNTFPDAGLVVAGDDEVGAQMGRELQKKAVWAVLASLAMMILYITIRFEFGFALGAILALAHDALIMIGVFAVLDRQFSLTFVAALLTVVGYSVNDTIVIFDRVRESLRLVKNKSFSEITNISINQTLNRTLLTSITTLITVVMLLIFGGGAIADFAIALFVGILVGTYSSIFIASPIMLWWHKDKKPLQMRRK